MKKIYTCFLSKILTLLFIILFPFLSFSQENVFLEQPSLKGLSFNSAQLSKLEKIKANPENKKVHVINVIDINKLRKSTELAINLPGSIENFTMYSKEIKVVSDNEITWYGELQGKQHGHMLLIEKNGAKYGQILIGDDLYKIEDFGKGKNILVQLKKPKLTRDFCATSNENVETITKHIKKEGALNNGLVKKSNNSTLEVLVLYTDNADAVVASPQNNAQTFIQQSNQALSNSGIPFYQLNFSLAGVQELDGFIETNNDSLDLDALRTNPLANQYRLAAEADIVVLLIDANYTNGVEGRAYVTHAGNKDFAYAIVEIDAPIPYVFTHEIGHLFGARHDNDNVIHNANISAYANGHNFDYYGTYTQTIMSAHQFGSNRVLHFSNPNTILPSYPPISTGTSSNNNTLQILDLKDQLVNYWENLDDDPPIGSTISVNLSGDFNISSYEYGTQYYTASVSGGAPPYSYQWCFTSTGCYNSASNVQSVTIWPNGNPQWSVQVTAIDSNGNTGSMSKAIQIQQFGGFGFFKDSFEQNITNIYPNPTKDSYQFDVKLDESSQMEVRLINILGQVEEVIFSGKKDRGVHTFKGITKSRRQGLYYVLIDIDGSMIYKKLLVQK